MACPPDGVAAQVDSLSKPDREVPDDRDRHNPRLDCPRHHRAGVRARLADRQRRDRLVAELARRAPQVPVTGIAAGMPALVVLPPAAQEQDVIAEAALRGLTLEGLAEFRTGTQQRGPALVVGYATPPGHVLSTGDSPPLRDSERDHLAVRRPPSREIIGQGETSGSQSDDASLASGRHRRLG